jgi:hypothetical protein
MAALLAVASSKTATVISNDRLGRWLKQNEGKIAAGLSLVRAGNTHGYPLWQLLSPMRCRKVDATTGRCMATKRLTRDEARRIAANIARQRMAALTPSRFGMNAATTSRACPAVLGGHSGHATS